MSCFSTGCPVVKRGPEDFVQFVSVGGQRQRVVFHREILWVQCSESKFLWMHGGKIIKEGSTYNDFYGYLSSCEMTDPTPEEMARFYSITPESSLELVVQTRVYLMPAVENEETRQYNQEKDRGYKAKYAYVPNDWRKETQDEDGSPLYPSLVEIDLALETTWTSKQSAEQNEAMLLAFRERWNVIPDPALNPY